MEGFRFGINKTKCMIMPCSKKLSEEPVWHLNGDAIKNVLCLDILEVKYDSRSAAHADNRSSKCKQAGDQVWHIRAALLR